MKVTSMVYVAIALVAMCAFSLQVDALTGPVTKCGAGFSPSLTACRAPATSSTPLSGAGPCCSCPFGSYNTDGVTCRSCTNGLVAISGVDLSKTGSQCFCLAGFGDYNSATQTCRQCPINTYSLNSKCVPCAAGTFAPAQSSVCAAVACPANSYLPPGGSTVGDCVRCKFGTVGQACSSVQACGCSAGFATFDKVAGTCQACSANSIAVYADAKLPDATNTVCFTCPAGTIASTDGRTCVAPTSGTTTTTTTAIASPNTVPANPIPSTACSAVPQEKGCLNGYDITVALVKNSLGANPTSIQVSVSHSADTAHPGMSGPSVSIASTSPLNNAIATAPGDVVFTDENGFIQGALRFDATTNNNALSVFGPTNGNMIPFYGLTCAIAKASLNLQAPCIQVKSGSAFSVKSLLPAGILAADGTGYSYDLTVQLSCSTTMAIVDPSLCPVGSSRLSVFDGIADDGASLNGNGVMTATGYIGGTGSSGFDTKVIAFYDASNLIQYVMSAGPNPVDRRVYLDGTTSFTGKTCTVGGDIAVCLPMNQHPTRIDLAMNFVKAGAAANVVSVSSACPPNNQ